MRSCARGGSFRFCPHRFTRFPTRTTPEDSPDRRDESLIKAVPHDLKALYKIRPIIAAVFDKGSFFEIGRQHGPSIVTGFARLDGYPVAVMASDPMILGGLWTAATARKVERFIDLADTFHLPVVHMVDNPGFMIGRVAEEEATIRYGSRAMTAVYQSTVPIVVVIMRKVYGMGGSAPANLSRFKWRFAWPSGDWGSLPISGGLEAAYRGELEASDDPAALLADITQRLNRVRSPFRTAEAFGVEDIIDPRDTRPMLCDFIEAAYRVLEAGPKARGYRC